MSYSGSISPTITDEYAQSIELDPSCNISEHHRQDSTLGETFIGLRVESGASVVDLRQFNNGPFYDLQPNNDAGCDEDQRVLNLVPYYFRANRAGKGHMRVGFKRRAI